MHLLTALILMSSVHESSSVLMACPADVLSQPSMLMLGFCLGIFVYLFLNKTGQYCFYKSLSCTLTLMFQSAHRKVELHRSRADSSVQCCSLGHILSVFDSRVWKLYLFLAPTPTPRFWIDINLLFIWKEFVLNYLQSQVKELTPSHQK